MEFQGIVGVARFYDLRISAVLGILKQEKIKEHEKLLIFRRLDNLIEKGKELIPKLMAINVPPTSLLMGLCFAGLKRRKFVEVDGWLNQFLCFEILEEIHYRHAIDVAIRIVERYIREDKWENARELLRKVSVKLQPPRKSVKQLNRLLTDKLTFLVKYGRTLCLEEETIGKICCETLNRMEKLREECVVYLHKAAV